MTTSFFRRFIFPLLVIAAFPFIALSQVTPAPQDRFAKLDTMRVHYQDYGNGKEAVVFIHGWSCSVKYWKANITPFVRQSRVMVGAFDAMMDETIWKRDKINAPTLAVMAKQPQWDAEYEKFVRDLVPGIDYQVWEGVSHFLMMDEPQKFNDTVLAFLKKNKLIKN